MIAAKFRTPLWCPELARLSGYLSHCWMMDEPFDTAQDCSVQVGHLMCSSCLKTTLTPHHLLQGFCEAVLPVFRLRKALHRNGDHA